jgi:transposase
VIDKIGSIHGGHPHKELVMMIKLLYIQCLYNLSDPELEEQVNDRLSFQRFAGIGMQETVQDYSTIWRFKEALVKANLLHRMFTMILELVENKVFW